MSIWKDYLRGTTRWLGAASVLFLLVSCSSETEHAIEGKWTESGGTETMEFFQDGTVAIEDQGTGIGGTFEFVDSARIRLDVAVLNVMFGGPVVAEVSIAGDELTMTMPNGDVQKYQRTGEARASGGKWREKPESEDEVDPPQFRITRVSRSVSEDSAGRGRTMVTADVENIGAEPVDLYIFSQSGVYMGTLGHALKTDSPGMYVPNYGLGIASWRADIESWDGGLDGVSEVCWSPVEEKQGESFPIKQVRMESGETRAFEIGVSQPLSKQRLKVYVITPQGRIESAILLDENASSGVKDDSPLVATE